MNRLQADLALGIAGLIWGFGFVAQKDALDHIGPFTFVATRFLISALIVLPLVLREGGFDRLRPTLAKPRNRNRMLGLCAAFAAGVIVQQYGLTATTVTNASFITGLYIVMVPFVGRFLFGDKLPIIGVIAGVISVIGIWLLSNGSIAGTGIHLGIGDLLIAACAICFALQVTLLGNVVKSAQAPFALSFIQYVAVGSIALLLALCFEHIDVTAIAAAWKSILFAGVASGGIAYTLQAVAQQHTPAADTAIIMSTESLFGGIGGVWMLGERLTTSGIAGCCAIMMAIGLVELSPQFKKRRRRGAVAKAPEKD